MPQGRITLDDLEDVAPSAPVRPAAPRPAARTGRITLDDLADTGLDEAAPPDPRAADRPVPAAGVDASGGFMSGLVDLGQSLPSRLGTDVGISALKGAIALPEAAVGLADIVTGGRAGKTLESLGFRPGEAKRILTGWYSDQQQEANRSVEEAQGVLGTAIAAITNPSTIGHAITESAPLMLAGGVAGRIVPKVGAAWQGAIGEGIISAGGAAEGTRQESADGLLTPKQSALAAGTGVATTALGKLGQRMAAGLGIEDVDTMIAAGAANPVATRALATRVALGAFQEGILEELGQSVAEQMLANEAQGKDLMDGVDHAAVMGSLTGAAMGGFAQLKARGTTMRDVAADGVGGQAGIDITDAAEAKAAGEDPNGAGYQGGGYGGPPPPGYPPQGPPGYPPRGGGNGPQAGYQGGGYGGPPPPGYPPQGGPPGYPPRGGPPPGYPPQGQITPEDLAPIDAAPAEAPPVAQDAPPSIDEGLTLSGGITDDQRAQLVALGYNPDAMTIVDAQEVLRQGQRERRAVPRGIQPAGDAPMTREGLSAMANAFANDPAAQAAVEKMKNAKRAEAPPRGQPEAFTPAAEPNIPLGGDTSAVSDVPPSVNVDTSDTPAEAPQKPAKPFGKGDRVLFRGEIHKVLGVTDTGTLRLETERGLPRDVNPAKVSALPPKTASIDTDALLAEADALDAAADAPATTPIPVFRGQQRGKDGMWWTEDRDFAQHFADSRPGQRGKVENSGEVREDALSPGDVKTLPYVVTDYATPKAISAALGIPVQATSNNLDPDEDVRVHYYLEDEAVLDALAEAGVKVVGAREKAAKDRTVRVFMRVPSDWKGYAVGDRVRLADGTEATVARAAVDAWSGVQVERDGRSWTVRQENLTAAPAAGPSIEVLDDDGPRENASGESGASAEAISRVEGMKARGEEFGYFDRAGRWTPLPDATAVDVKALPGMTTGVLSHDGTFVRRDDNGGKVPSTLPKPVNVKAPGQQDGATEKPKPSFERGEMVTWTGGKDGPRGVRVLASTPISVKIEYDDAGVTVIKQVPYGQLQPTTGAAAAVPETGWAVRPVDPRIISKFRPFDDDAGVSTQEEIDVIKQWALAHPEAVETFVDLKNRRTNNVRVTLPGGVTTRFNYASGRFDDLGTEDGGALGGAIKGTRFRGEMKDAVKAAAKQLKPAKTPLEKAPPGGWTEKDKVPKPDKIELVIKPIFGGKETTVTVDANPGAKSDLPEGWSEDKPTDGRSGGLGIMQPSTAKVGKGGWKILGRTPMGWGPRETWSKNKVAADGEALKARVLEMKSPIRIEDADGTLVVENEAYKLKDVGTIAATPTARGWVPNLGRADGSTIYGPPTTTSDAAFLAAYEVARDLREPVKSNNQELLEVGTDEWTARIADGIKRATKTTPAPAAAPKKDGPPSKYTEVGVNAEGQTLYEDTTGVRSLVKDGIRIYEPVKLIPTRAGMTTGVSNATRPAEFKLGSDVTMETIAAADDAERAAAKPKESVGHAAIMSPGAQADWWDNATARGAILAQSKSHGRGYVWRLEQGMNIRVAVFEPEGKGVGGYVRLGLGQVEPVWRDGKLVVQPGSEKSEGNKPEVSGKDPAPPADFAAAKAAKIVVGDIVTFGKDQGHVGELKDGNAFVYVNRRVDPDGRVHQARTQWVKVDGLAKVPSREQTGEPSPRADDAAKLAARSGTPVAPAPEEAQTQGEATDAGSNPRTLGSAESRAGEKPAGQRAVGDPPEARGGRRDDDDRGRDSAGDEPRPGQRTGVGRDRPATADEGREDRPAGGEPGPVATEGNSPSNYRIAPDDNLGAGGKVTKFRQNIAAIKLAKQIQSENRPATAAEQAILIKFVGWGGLKRELSDAERDLINDGTLTEPEYRRAFQSTLNAHYTTPGLIRAMWAAVGDLGFTHGKVLEPGMGVGHFLGMAPADIRPTSLFGVELDPLTALIAQQLYPQSKIQATGYQDAQLPADYFDLAISNVPFGDYLVPDPASKIPKFVRSAIHNYYFAKTLQKVRPGGLIAFITTHGTLDAASRSDVRAYLGERADFLGAVRLPDTAFKENAATEVVTDIILMRRRLPGEAARHVYEDWTNTSQMFQSDENYRGVPVSNYFKAHPEQVIGTMAAQGTMYGGGGQELSVKHSGKDVPERAAEALKRLTDHAVAAGLGYKPMASEQRAALPDEVAPDAVLEQMFYLDEADALRQRQKGLGVDPALGERPSNILRAYLPVRDAYRQAVATMSAVGSTDKDVAKARLPLAKAYDAFVKKFGPLHKAANAKLITRDPYGPAVLAIESWDADTEKAKKADIFTKRTIMADVRPDTAGTPTEALLVSLSETGGIDWPRISELLSMTIDQAKDALIGEGRVFETPSGVYETSERYLSGRVRDKLALARDAAAIDGKFERNVAALEVVQPADLPESRITVNLGAPWVPVDLINNFITHLGGNLKAHYRAATAEWGLTNSGWSAQSTREWETGAADLSMLMHHTLNNQQVVIRNRDGSANERATVEAQAKQAEIRKEFSRWAFDDVARAGRMVRSYNDTHNATVLATHDGSHLTLPGMAESWRSMLRPHQVNAIWRAILEGNTYLAHTMGAGKTVVMAAIAMESKRLGLARKPIIVIPKQTLSDYARFAEFYPKARVLIGTKESTQGAARKEFMARIATGDWDAIIVTRDAMKRMPAGAKAWEEFLAEQITELREASAEEDSNKVSTGGRRQLSDLARKLERLEAKLREMQKKIEDKADEGLVWEDLGVDMILADEAHAYRKLMLSTNLDQVAGIPVGPGSGLTNDLYIKARAIEKATPGRGLVMASGTPLVNSVAEMYVLQKFLQPQALKMAGVDKFDAWASTFGEIVTKYEADVTGTKLKLKRRFSEFANMNGLIQMFRSVMDVMLPEDLNLPTPPVTGGEAEIVSVDAGPALQKFMQALDVRVANLDPRDRRTDNMLKISGDGQKAALDLRIVGREPGGAKLDAVTEHVVAKYKQWDKVRGTQLIFLELGVPGGSTWPVYETLKSQLVKAGIPAAQVAFISDGNTDARRDALMQKMRTGDIRVMIGPRQTMGTGVNVQHRLVGMHHVDPHWLPALIDQADGRGIRQGNLFFMKDSPERIEGFSMDITHYVTKNSFDAYQWQAVSRKGFMINQAMRGNLSLDRIEEIGGGQVFDAAEIAAIASNNPILLERAILERKIQNLQLVADSHGRKQRDRRNDVARLPGAIEEQKAALADLRAYAAKVPTATIQIGGKAVSLEEADAAVKQKVGKLESPAEVEALGGNVTPNAWGGFDTAVKIGTILGRTFGVHIRVEYDKKQKTLAITQTRTAVDTPKQIAGVNGVSVEPATRLMAALTERVSEWIKAAEQGISESESKLADARKYVEAVFPDQEELDAAKARLTAIETEMGKNDSVAAPADEADDDDVDFGDDDDEGGGGKVGGSENAAIGDFLERPRSSAIAPASVTAKTGLTRLQGEIELPEAVALMRELALDTKVVTAFQKAGVKARFVADATRGEIQLRADLFKPGNEQQLAAAMFHEIGHATDWMPDGDLKRGNVLGRLRTMHRFLRHSFTDADGETVTLKAVRDELKALSAEWRPWPEKGEYTDSYKRYRDSGKELYADAISVLFNDPGMLEAKAPIFFKAFFAELDNKPDVERAYFDLQELLTGTPEQLIQRRRTGVRTMFARGDATALEVERLRQAEVAESQKHIAYRLRLQMVDKNIAVSDRMQALAVQGRRPHPDFDPLYALKEIRHLGAKQTGYLERTFQPIYKATQAVGLDWTSFGEALFYERILAEPKLGGRAGLANPRGITVDAARGLLKNLRDSLTTEQTKALDQGIKDFRAAVKEVAEAAFDAGLYKPELYEQLQDSESWASFRVIDYMHEDVTAKIHQGKGTLKDIQNPADATIAKMLVTIRAAEYNAMKVKTFKALQSYDASETEPAKMVWDANRQGLTPAEPAKGSKKVLIRYLERGVLRGMWVPQDVADAIENNSIGQNLAILQAVRWANSKWFRPAFTTMNLGFQGANFFRDFWRYWTNIPTATLRSALTNYVKAMPVAAARSFGQDGPISKRLFTKAQRDQALKDLAEAQESRILGATWNDAFAGRAVEDTAIEDTFAQHGLGGPPDASGNFAVRQVQKLVTFIQNTGDFIETLPKAAAIHELRNGRAISEMTAEERAYIREKVGSPDFLISGTLKPITNELFLFSNAITQAIRADYAVAVDPTSRGSFWRKNAAAFMVPVALGFFVEYFGHLMGGDDDEDDEGGWRYVQKILQGVSEYDKTNYTIIPIKLDEHGNSVYFRIPRSDAGRLLAAMLRKALRTSTGDAGVFETLATLVDYSAGQVPGLTPSLTLGSDVVSFASNQNIYDAFRSREVFTRDEMDAANAGDYAPKTAKFLRYEFQQMGGGIVYRVATGEDRPEERTPAQKVLELPIVSNVVGRFVRISNYGHLERSRKVAAKQRGVEASTRITERKAVANALREYQQLPPPRQTRDEQIRIARQVEAALYTGETLATRQTKQRDILKKIRMGVNRGGTDWLVDSVMSAGSTAQRVAVINDAFSSAAERAAWVRLARKEEVISEEVVKALQRAEVPR